MLEAVHYSIFLPFCNSKRFSYWSNCCSLFRKVVTHDATFRILAKLRVQVFKKLIPLSPSVLNRYRNTDLLNRLVTDVDTLDGLYLRLLAPIISAIVVIGFITLGLALFNIPLALFIGSSLLILLLVIPILFYHLGTKFGNKLTLSLADYRTRFVEFIQAQAELLLFNSHLSLKQQLDQTEKEWQSYQLQEAKLSGVSTAILLFANGIILSCTLWFAADADFSTSGYKTAIIALFTFASLAAFEILMPIGAAFLHIGQLIASAERVNEIIKQTPLVQFTGNETIENTTALSITFNNVCFTYPEREDIALNTISFSVLQGEKVAILGKTGSGKSTLLQLIVRNYDPIQGEILLAGKPIQSYSEQSLRQHICLLTQRVHIFSDTLRNNLQIANSQLINDEKMRDILKLVGLKNLLEQPEDLDLWLGDGGRPLSGGEQRRLGLARILLNDAPILLLDEPTEGLDRETERQILKLILAHCQHKTLLMVTHRLTAIEQFDLICIIDDTKLIEQGSYTELCNKPDGYFRQLIERID